MYFTNGYTVCMLNLVACLRLVCYYLLPIHFYLKVMNKPEDGGLPSVKLFYLPGDEEESQEDIGEYLVSQGAFR